ncbi:MAG: response regulator [Granulosicoccus sp.]
MRIQAKLLLFAILCSVLPLIATFSLSFDTVKDSLSQTVQKNLISQAKEQLDTLQSQLASSKHELVTLSKLSTMQNVITGDLAGNLQYDIDTFAKRAPLFAEIVVVDYDGLAVASTLQEYVNHNFNGTWEFEAPKLGINFDGRVVKSYRLDRYIATQSVPLYSAENPEKIIGALIGSIDWNYLQREMSMNSVFGGDQSQQRQVFLQSLESDWILYGTADVKPPLELMSAITDSADVRHVIHEDRNYILVSIHSRPFREFRDPRWKLSVLLDADIAYASVNELKNYFLIAGGFVLLLVIALGMLFARSIVTPVKSLVTGAERLSAGDYEYELPQNNARDEIGQLTHSFNAMRVAVRHNEQELVTKTEVAQQAARLKGEFLANMSHEVRTPINGVLGMTELLLNTSLDAAQSRYAKTISRSGQALLAVINDILDFSKIEAGKLELSRCAFDLRDLVEDVVEMVAETAHKKGVEVVLLVPPESHVAFNGDSARLRQVLLNLLSNAVKFTAQGEVKLLVDCAEQEEGLARVNLKVVDTGIGIEASNQKKIFESFVQADGSTTREFGGTGLGLAISSKLVDLMGGKMGVSSVAGQGSTFWVEIELQQLSSSVELAWREPDSLKDKRILIVDDNQTNREILENQVIYWGAEPTVATNAVEALKALERASNTNTLFDAAILDMQMPLMSGTELAKVMHDRKLAITTRIILLSSACDNLDSQTCKRIGIHSTVNKPVRQPDLHNCLTAAIITDSSTPHIHRSAVKKIKTTELHGHVLLAEDNPVNQDMMLEMMRLQGLTTELACNGEEVLTALEKNDFDLVLMDCQMPILDGFAATRKIRDIEDSLGKNRHIPIIALTANAMQGDRERCLAAGMDDYLSKPVSSLQLRNVMTKWLKESGNSSPIAQKPTDSKPIQDAGSSSTATEKPTGMQPSSPEIHADYSSFVDERIFSELLVMCENAPAGFYNQLVKKFDESSIEDLNSMSNALNERNAKQLGSSAHRLKSSSASWGATRLTELLQALELASRNGKLEHAPILLKHVIREHNVFLQFLRIKESRAA